MYFGWKSQNLPVQEKSNQMEQDNCWDNNPSRTCTARLILLSMEVVIQTFLFQGMGVLSLSLFIRRMKRWSCTGNQWICPPDDSLWTLAAASTTETFPITSVFLVPAVVKWHVWMEHQSEIQTESICYQLLSSVSYLPCCALNPAQKKTTLMCYPFLFMIHTK